VKIANASDRLYGFSGSIFAGLAGGCGNEQAPRKKSKRRPADHRGHIGKVSMGEGEPSPTKPKGAKMKTYYYRPVGMRYKPKLKRLKQPITLCQTCAWIERGNAVITTQHTPKAACDRCGKEEEK
jgi:hypothetical protein